MIIHHVRPPFMHAAGEAHTDARERSAMFDMASARARVQRSRRFTAILMFMREALR